jgi:hypothetical protein
MIMTQSGNFNMGMKEYLKFFNFSDNTDDELLYLWFQYFLKDGATF